RNKKFLLTITAAHYVPMFSKIFNNFGKYLRQYSTDVKSIENIDDETKDKISNDAFLIFMNVLIIGQKTFKAKIIPHDPSDDLSNQNMDNSTIFKKLIKSMLENQDSISKNEKLEESEKKRLLNQSSFLVSQLVEMSEIIRKTEEKESGRIVNNLKT
ncbi:unnamed protein product, partial [Brachionus calyciflorus]